MSLIAILKHSKGYGRCRSCGAPVVWVETVRGTRIPFNPPLAIARTQETLLAGDDTRTIEHVDSAVSTSHFATCPDATQWRKTKR